MRIISNFHDYYDSVRQYGADPKLVYVRETKELYVKKTSEVLTKKLPEIYSSIRTYFKCSCDQLSHGVICFRGSMYPYVVYDGAVCYNSEHIIDQLKYCSKYDWREKKNILEAFLKPHVMKGAYGKFTDTYFKSGPLTKDHFDLLLKKDLSLDDDVFISLGAPVFIFESGDYKHYDEYRITLNPRLNRYGFASQVSPYDAFQKLAAYIGSNMVLQMDPNVGITDIDRRDSAGFDKWSFRKHKDDPRV